MERHFNQVVLNLKKSERKGHRRGLGVGGWGVELFFLIF